MGTLLVTAGKSRYFKPRNDQSQYSNRSNTKRDLSMLHSEIERLETALRIKEDEFTKTNDFEVLQAMRILKKKIFDMKRKYI